MEPKNKGLRGHGHAKNKGLRGVQHLKTIRANIVRSLEMKPRFSFSVS